MLDWPLEIQRKERRWTSDSGVLFFCTVFCWQTCFDGRSLCLNAAYKGTKRTQSESARERRQNDRISRSFVSAGQANRRAVACWQLQQRRRRTRVVRPQVHNTVVRNYEQTSNYSVCSIKYKNSCHHHWQVSAQRNTKVHFTSTTSGTALQCRWH